jgi:SNF2 Helicase protein
MPAGWRANRPPRPQVTAQIGGKAPSGLGQDALLDFRMEVTLDGERLTAAEIGELLAKSDGLELVRGRWVEVNREQLSRMMEHFRAVERTAAEKGLGFREAMRRRVVSSGRWPLARRDTERIGNYFDRRNVLRTTNRLVKRLEALGHRVTLQSPLTSWQANPSS